MIVDGDSGVVGFAAIRGSELLHFGTAVERDLGLPGWGCLRAGAVTDTATRGRIIPRREFSSPPS
jgi:hypothetical protein